MASRLKTLAAGVTAATLALVGSIALAPSVALAAEVEDNTEETVVETESAPEVTEESSAKTTEGVAEEADPDAAPEAVEEVAPAVEEAPAEDIVTLAAPPLVPTEGLIPLGITGTISPGPGFPTIEHERYLPVLRTAHIGGLAKPETPTGTAPDEVRVDLRSLVGSTGGPDGAATFTGFGFTADGALCQTPTDFAGVAGCISEPLDWAEFSWRLSGIGSVGVIDTVSLDGAVTLVPFAEFAEYGIEATLIHTATGIEAQPIRITGFTGANSGGADWVTGPQRLYEGGIPMWEAWDRGAWRDGRMLSWGNPREVISPTGVAEVRATSPSVLPGLRADSGSDLGTPAGFGLTNYNGVVQAGVEGSGTSYRVGQLHGEPIERVVFDLADVIPGAVAVALPSAPSGTLALDPSAGWLNGTLFMGLDYQAPTGLTFTADGTTVTATFGSAEWVNRFGLAVPVLTADGAVEWAEIRSETLPRDIAGGVIEKRIPTDTVLTITDDEMLSASRLTGLSPSLAEVQAAELPAGVTRVDGGFEYVGSAEPTELAFGFTVAETVETPFGPVRPDSSGDGEVRIEVIAADAPVDPEPEPTPEAPEPQPEPEAPAPKAGAPKANPGANTGGEFTPASSEQNAAAVGLFGGLMAALGALLGFAVGRRKKASA